MSDLKEKAVNPRDAEGTEENIKDQQIEYILKNLGRVAYSKKYRWAHVVELFGVGSTTAKKICRQFDMDPEEIIGVDPCGGCICTDPV